MIEYAGAEPSLLFVILTNKDYKNGKCFVTLISTWTIITLNFSGKAYLSEC